MADADPAGTSSTPSTAASTTADPAAAATTTTQPVAADPAATTTTAAADPAKVETPDPASFTLPEDIKFNPEAVTSLQTALKGKLVDGKLNLTAQDVANFLADQARGGMQRWAAQQAEQDRAWEAQSKQRFTPAQLAQAEAAIGFLTSRQLAAAEKAGLKDVTPFRDLAKGFKNHPDFVEVMRIVGDSLNEDTFEQGGNVPTRGKKSLAERMYPNSKPS